MIPLVVVVEDMEGGGRSQFAFLKSPVRIGRGELNDLQLDRPFVSTYHGLVQFDEGGARYVDLGSTNGSLLDGVLLDRNALVPITARSEVVIGTFRLRFERRSTGEHPAATPRMTAFSERVSTIAPAETPVPVAAPVPPPGAPDRLWTEPELEPLAVPEAPPPLPFERKAAAEPDPLQAQAIAGAARAEAEARKEAEARVEATLAEGTLELDLQYTSYRGSWEYFRAAMEATLAPLDGLARRIALERLVGRYPAMRGEGVAEGSAPPVAPASAPERPGPAAPPMPVGDADAIRLLAAFAQSYAPSARPAAGPAEVERMLARVAGVLETFARSFLELRRGYEEFGREMGVRTVQGEGVLTRAGTAEQVLIYLLDPRHPTRDAELQRSFADFMIHQVALLRGVVEGTRAVLGDLSPERIEEATPSRGFAFASRASALWKTYEEKFRELAEEDAALSERLFGKEFARAYAAMSGDTSAAPSGGAHRHEADED
jgi:type VI secretion system FHA domain protein